MHSGLENLCRKEVSKYLSDRIRSGHAGVDVNNGPEGKKLKSGRPEKSSESIASLGNFAFDLFLYFCSSKVSIISRNVIFICL